MKLIPEDKVVTDVPHSSLVHDPARNSIASQLAESNFSVGVEIGVQYGQGSSMWLKNNLVNKMYGIDPYIDDEKTFGIAMGRMMQFDDDQYIHIRKRSNDALTDVDGLVDFVYIDGAKDRKSVVDDITYWYPKIRRGGIMFGHDYHHVSYPHMTPLVDEYFGIVPHLMDGGIWWHQKGAAQNKEQVTVVTPFYNTGFFARDIIKHIEDPRVKEMIIVDDHSLPGETEMLLNVIKGNSKIKYIRNEENLGELKTRIKATQLATTDWVIFLDGDNSLTQDYLDSIYSIPRWREDVIYHPSFGNERKINYTQLEGTYLNKENISRIVKDNLYMMTMFLNTGNYLMNRHKYLATAIPLQDVPKHEYGDIIINGEWLKNNYIFVVENMKYVHRLRKNSAWKDHAVEMKVRIDQVIKDLI